MDQLIIGNKGSLDDFGASVSGRAISAPKKKSIKKTVAFSNVTYDFSKINGELYWEERELEYEFEIIADDPVSLEEMKAKFSAWVMNVMEEQIFDPYDPNFYYIGTFDDIKFKDEDCVEKSTITVTFLAYPYKIARTATLQVFTLPASSTTSIVVNNSSAHRVVATFKSTNAKIIGELANGYTKLIVFDGAKEDPPEITLEPGKQVFYAENQTERDVTLTASYFEELF